MSAVMCQVSVVMCKKEEEEEEEEEEKEKNIKVEKLVGAGSFLNGATPSSLSVE